MCTIMTFDYDTFKANSAAIELQIRDDALFNNDGWSLLINGDEPTLLKTLSLELVLKMLNATTFNRFWLHSRYATTRAHGLVHTHGFSGGDWLVFHNGVLTSDESRAFPVDSQLIAARVQELGALPGLQSLSHERYLNAFVVNTNTGQWYVSRHVTNDLFTDGACNYSTNQIPTVGCVQLVADNTITAHNEDVVSDEQWEMEYVKYLRDDDFYDLVCDMRWDQDPVPEAVYRELTPDQRRQIRCMRRFA